MSDATDAENWFARVRRAAEHSTVDRGGEWDPFWVLRDLYDEAERLRFARPDDAWKEPFNRFRYIFTRRDKAALQRFAAGGEP